MKRILAFIITAALILTVTSCGNKVDEQGDVTVVIETEKGDYEVYMTYLENVEHKHEGLLAILKNLHARPENPMHLVYSDGAYGEYVTEIGSVKEDSANGVYITYYTSLETDSYHGAPTVTYGESLLFLAGVGVSLASVTSGSVFLFRAEASPF